MNSSDNLTIVVADDSLLYRKIIRDAIASIDGVRVVDVAKDGDQAIEKCLRHQPDLITLDHEMPGKTGLQVLQVLRDKGSRARTVLVSGLADASSSLVSEALKLGVDGFILKPAGDDAAENQRELTAQLRSQIDLIRRAPAKVADRSRDKVTSRPPIANDAADTTFTWHSVDAIGIGISTGGPKTLCDLVSKIRHRVTKPIFIVQHMPVGFTRGLAECLDTLSDNRVVEAADGMSVQSGTVYLAPGGRHMRVTGSKDCPTIAIDDENPLRGCRPSVDYLFDSMMGVYGRRLLGVIMTGMGDDGLRSCGRLAASGGRVWTQNEVSSTVFGMPRIVQESGVSSWAFSPDQFAARLSEMRAGGRSTASTRTRSLVSP